MARNLPARVHEKSGRYYYVSGRRNEKKWIALTKVEAGLPALRDALVQLHQNAAPTTYADLFDLWQLQPHQLSPSTRRDYDAALQANPTGRVRKAFGRMRLGTLKPTHIAQYLEKRGGVIANREMSALAHACNWAQRKGWLNVVPTRGVRRNKEKPRDRYVSDEELQDALERASEALSLLLRGAYLTGFRQGDLRSLRLDQVTEEGIVLQESKRGKRIIMETSDELQDVLDQALARTRCNRVFTNTRGEPWTTSAITSAMTRLNLDWTFHDLRAKSESDHEEGLGLLTRYKRAKRLRPVR